MSRFSIVFVFGIVLIVAVTADQAAWKSFKLRHNKQYKNVAEERHRMKHFINSLKRIAEHNELFKKGVVSYEKGLNEFSDMSDDEFHSTMSGGFGPDGDDDDDSSSSEERQTHEVSDDDDIPESFDWRKKGAVTSVKYQGHCGSCWIFTASGALEGAHFIKTGVLRSLSEQNLLDCVREDESKCYGGNWPDAYDYIIDNGGIDTDKSYPYKGRKGQCEYDPDNSAATVKDYVFIPKGNETALTHAIATFGPVAFSVNDRLFRDYKGGIFDEPGCSGDHNHEMLAVGYGTDDKHGDYYIMKNSWGTSWGINGYIKMARKGGNQCGIANHAGYPII